MWPRLALDGAILNRTKIWLAGLRLFAANPLGVEFGKSGEIASAFMLPDGITVRTLVNSHLTLLAEMGVLVGGAWLAFIALALTGIRQLPRTGIAFSGLVISACSASVFDGPVLFDFADDGGYGLVNFVLSWGLLLAFLGMGIALTVRGVRGAHGVIALPSGLAAVVLAVLPFLVPTTGVPRVERGWVRYGAGGPQAYHDASWSLKAIRGRLPEGAVIRIANGVGEMTDGNAQAVWLFGSVAEASHRFPNARVTVVDPPEYYEPEENVSVR